MEMYCVYLYGYRIVPKSKNSVAGGDEESIVTEVEVTFYFVSISRSVAEV